MPRIWMLNTGESTGHFIETLSVLVGRELRMRYKGSLFGIMWALFSPLGNVVILQFLFTRILSIPIPNFSVFMYSALLPWVWFQGALQSGTTTLTENGDLVRTPFFSKTLLPCVVTVANFLLYFLALPVLFGLMAYNGVPFTRALLALPIIWAVEAMLALGFTVLVAAFGILARDVQHLLGIVLVFWFYLTPIFYSIDQLPPDLRWRFYINPMTVIVSAHRSVTLYGQPPDWGALAYVTVVAAGVVTVGLLVFRAVEDVFIEQL